MPSEDGEMEPVKKGCVKHITEFALDSSTNWKPLKGSKHRSKSVIFSC